MYFLSLVSLSFGLAMAAFGPISTSSPKFPQTTNSLIAPTAIWKSNAPYQTDAFFQNLVLGTGQMPINILPYIIKIEGPSGGLGVGAPRTKEVTWGDVRTPYYFNWVIGAREGKFERHRILSHDKLSVNVEFPKGQGKMMTPLVRGSAMITAHVEKLRPYLYTENGLITVTMGDGTKISRTGSSNKFVLQLTCGGFWVLYTSQPVTITFTKDVFNFQNQFTGTLRLGYLGTTADSVGIFDKYKNSIPTSGSIDYSISGTQATISFTYSTESLDKSVSSNTSPLIFALPHHLDSLVNPVKQNLVINVYKGDAVAIVGNVWNLKEDLVPMPWQVSRGYSDKNQEKEVKQALKWDVMYFTDPKRVLQTNPELFGNQVTRLARLALISETVGDSAKEKACIDAIKRMMTQWLTGAHSNKLVYDTTWGGLVTTDGLKSQSSDYGNGLYQNHQVAYGYHIYALAVVGRYDSSFLKQYEEEILAYVRDVANPSSQDTYFPVSRQKDWYYGHSWAGGLIPHYHNRNLQSISETINCYYSISLLGKALQNSELEQWGRLLATTEIRSAKKYFQVIDSSIYPAQFAANHVVGTMWDTKVDQRSYQGQNQEYAHALQMIPFTPLTEYLIDSTYAGSQNVVLGGLTTHNEWLSYVLMNKAIVDKNGAWQDLTTTTDISYWGRNSETNALWWVATRP